MDLTYLNTLCGSDTTKYIYAHCFLKNNHKNPYINTIIDSKHRPNNMVNAQCKSAYIEVTPVLNAESHESHESLELPSFMFNETSCYENIKEYEVSREYILNPSSYNYSNSEVNPHIERKPTKRKTSTKQMSVSNKKFKLTTKKSTNINNNPNEQLHVLKRGRARIIQLKNMTVSEKYADAQFILERNRLASKHVRQQNKLNFTNIKLKLIEYKDRDIHQQLLIELLQHQKTELLKHTL